ncbi:MAG: hypothetical protein CFE31_09930 [Rhizobiales bacterium PAR1]|nr:MAG: hypothetical protein CFE31_09930 [Rhizobiales bacterium PAR1]
MSEAVGIIEANPTLLAAFLLRHPTLARKDLFTDARASRFLLWFAIEGRRRFQGVRFSPEYLAFLSGSVGPFPSRLAAYAAASRIEETRLAQMDIGAICSWYYRECVPELRLEPLISLRERAELQRILATSAPDIPLPASPLFQPRPANRNADLPGVNVIGFAEGVLGIGEDARALVRVLDHAGIPFSIINLALPDRVSRQAEDEYAGWVSDRPIFPVNVFAITAFETARLSIEQGSNLFEGRYNIGYWPWELTDLPTHWRSVVGLVDEVWASSGFLEDVYSRMQADEVHLMPPYINPPKPVAVDLEEFGFTVDEFIVLTMFDFNSYMARKNPLGAIAAFRKAFPDTEGNERLIIKSVNSQAHPEALAALEAEIMADHRIVLLDGTMERAEVFGLIEMVDCFLSLHRAEGFGRVMAEAMLLGTPVVATNWSGNTSFLDQNLGFPVDFSLRPVRQDEYPFWEGSSWAEPSIEDAAAKLALVRSRQGELGPMLDAARSHIQNQFGLDATVEAVATRLRAIKPILARRF